MAPCTRCTRLGVSCVLAPNYKCCSECVKTGRSCDCTGVPLSAWKSVENALEKLKKEEKEAEQDILNLSDSISRANARLLRIRKLKKFQETREDELLQQDALTLDELDAAADSPIPATFDLPDPLDPSLWEPLDLGSPSQMPSTSQGS